MFAQKYDLFSSINLNGLESYTALFYKGAIHILGGKGFANVLNDKIWRSPTGYIWEDLTPNPIAVAPNVMHAGFLEGDGVVWKNKMLIAGGLDDSLTVMATVLSSTDGINWVAGKDLTAAVHKHRCVIRPEVVGGVASQGTLTLSGVVIEGETFTIGADVYEIDSDGVVSGTNIAADVSASVGYADGTVTVDTQPSIGESFTIGNTVYLVTADGTAAVAGEVDEGTDLADFKVNLTAALEGTDGYNVVHALIDASAWATHVLTITAKIGGIVGNASPYTLATTSVAGGNTVSGALLTGGTDCTAPNAVTALVAAEVASGTEAVTAVDGAGDTVVVTANFGGVAGDLIALAKTGANMAVDGAFLGTTTAGVDPVQKMYQIGGTTDGTTPLEKIYESSDADLPGGTWTQTGVDVLPVPLMSFSIALWNGRFWVAGGITTAGAYSKKMFSTTDLETDWAEEGTDASPEVQNATLVPMGKFMYLIGGNTAAGPSRKVYKTEDGINWVDLGNVLPFGSENRDAIKYVNPTNDKVDARIFVIAGTTLRDEVYQSKLDFDPFGWVDVTLPRHWEVTATNGTWVGDHWEPKDNGATFDLQLEILTGSTWFTWKRPTAIKFGIYDIGASPGAIGIDVLDVGPASIGADAAYNHGEIALVFGGTDDLNSFLIDLDVTYKVNKIELYYPKRPL